MLPFFRVAVSLPLKILDLFGVSCLLNVGGVDTFEPCLPAAIFKLTNFFCLFFMNLFEEFKKCVEECTCDQAWLLVIAVVEVLPCCSILELVYGTVLDDVVRVQVCVHRFNW